MLISEIYSRLGSFVNGAINNNSVKVYSASQSSGRSTKPFITIALSRFEQKGGLMRYEIDSNGIQDTIMSKTFTVSFQAFSDVLHQAEDLLNIIQNKLPTDYAYSFFKSEMAYLKTLMGVSALPTAINAENESRAILEAEFSTAQLIKIDVGFIEHVSLNDIII